MSEVKQSPKVELTLEQFQATIAQATKAAVEAAIAETRKPSEKDLKELAQTNEERKANAADVKAQIEAAEGFQKICAHNQDRNRDAGKTACVYVDQDFPKMPNGGKYLCCQQCGAKIVPGPAPEGKDKKNQPLSVKGFTYDTALFIKHMQMIRFE